ncbi:lipase 3 [Plutella xylostella]|uniref:lipase 3 n=1 Tax=Plutella xylostella TaxID=51655 RepID=UPI002032DB16|nr:lipase 3 [Plutella xylostella]
MPAERVTHTRPHEASNMRLILLLCLCAARAQSYNPFFDVFITNSVEEDTTETINTFFTDSTTKMRAFLDGQRNKVEKVWSSSYESAVKMKDSVQSFVDEKQKKMTEDFTSYVESVKESSRKVVDNWSFLPTADEVGARLDNPPAALSVPAIIARNGYPCETHTVVSEGYILNVHRIPRAFGTDTPSKTVLLQHGLFASSADWILNGPEKGLAYTLADAGYDVWMANIRGNKYSREHAWLKTDSKSYWNFSWHDVAQHDVPAIIDYIMKLKGSGTKITYIGHSMGTTILFAMLTLRPEYNKILSSGIALAPVVFNTDVKSPLKVLAPIASHIAYTEMLYGSHEFIPKNSALGKLTSSCDASNPDSSMCKNVMFYICGHDEQQFNKLVMPVFLAHLGTGTSWKTALHFAQEAVAGGKFQQFDYGYNNQKVYGTDNPPEYDLSKVTLPITLFWAQNDLLSSEKDVKLLYEKLPKKTTRMYLVPFPEFNHLDYLWAVDAPTLLNNKILEFLQKT